MGPLTDPFVDCTDSHMPYFVAKGTQGRVITPGGRVIEPFYCRRDSTFEEQEAEDHGIKMVFRRGGYTLIVLRSAVRPADTEPR